MKFPLGIMRIASDHMHGVASRSQALGEAGGVWSVTGWFRGVIQAEDGYTQVGSSHKCNNSAERARVHQMKLLVGGG